MSHFRHPIHPILVHFPIAFLSAGTLADSVALMGRSEMAPQIAWGLLVAGLLTGIAAVLAGMLDFIRLDDAVAKRVSVHASLMMLSLSAYGVALFARSDGFAPAADLGWLGSGASVVGFVLLIAGGYYGGDLVYVHRAGVRASAHERDAEP